ncbi:MAG: hypothetical protein V4653_18345 [Pseudomonadota bacterium]
MRQLAILDGFEARDGAVATRFRPADGGGTKPRGWWCAIVSLASLVEGLARQETERFQRFTYAELAAREKLDLNLPWLGEEDASDPSTLPRPAEIAGSMADDQEAALPRFRAVAACLT